MEQFLKRRASDPRFKLGTHVSAHSTTAVSAWYRHHAPVHVEHFTFSAPKAASSDESPKKKKSRKLRRKPGSEEFTESQKKELRERDTSDGSDSGGCWSGYESTGKPKGEKDSCRKKKKSAD